MYIQTPVLMALSSCHNKYSTNLAAAILGWGVNVHY